VARAPHLQSGGGIECCDLRLPSHHDVAAFIQQTKRGALYSVFYARTTFTSLSVNNDQVVVIADVDTIWIRQDQVSNTFVSAFVSP
jgi:hypothetical protein